MPKLAIHVTCRGAEPKGKFFWINMVIDRIMLSSVYCMNDTEWSAYKYNPIKYHPGNESSDSAIRDWV